MVEQFVKNGESVVATQRSFRRHFSVNRHDPVPTGKTICRWVSNFRQTSSALNRRRSGGPRTRTAQENVTAVADSIEQSPRRSLRKHAFALHKSATSVHRILHRSLHMKIMVVQEINPNLPSVPYMARFIVEQNPSKLRINKTLPKQQLC